MKGKSSKLKGELMTFEDFFQYRNIWMLFAILWVALFHWPLQLPPILRRIGMLGYGGVDIFLFASGIGCWFSLEKDPDARAFLGRRLAAILPMQLIFLVFFVVYRCSVSSVSILQIAGNIFGTGFFAGLGNQFNWYIGAMWICYLLAPVFKSLVRSSGRYYLLLMLLGLLAVSAVFFGHYQLIFWSRLPVFFLGLAVAECGKRLSVIRLRTAAGAFGLMLLGLGLLYACMQCPEDIRWSYGLWWYPFLLITPGLTLLISLLARWLSAAAGQGLVKGLVRLGRHTFPLYLSHLFLFEISAALRPQLSGINDVLYGLLTLAAVIAFAVLLHYLAKLAVYACGRFSTGAKTTYSLEERS